ncbi:MAG: hypothetical protein WBV77_07780 [Solirubrobacteraceae bacterium]
MGLIALPNVGGIPRVLADILSGVGTAAVVAAILGFTVDAYLKVELLRDAFRALFGYLLPEELRDELGWITEQEVLCKRYDLTLTLKPTDDAELLTAEIEWHAEVRNVTSHRVAYRPIFALDEWFQGHPSEVTQLRCTRGDATDSDTTDLPAPFAVARGLQEMDLHSKEQVTVVAAGRETRRRSDAFFMNLQSAAIKPVVTVRAPDGIAWEVMFGNRVQNRLREIGLNARELPGTMLPGQVIQVRWWPTEENE